MSLDSTLQSLRYWERKLHRLNNRWPCGIRSIDDQADEERAYAALKVEEIRLEVARLRKAEVNHRRSFP